MPIFTQLLLAFQIFVASANTPPPQRVPTEAVEGYLEKPLIVETIETKETIVPKVKLGNACSCVKFAQLNGLPLKGYGAARNYPINSEDYGRFVKTSEGPIGHLAVVIGRDENTITIKEANYKRCQIGTRVLKKDDPHIVGYIQ